MSRIGNKIIVIPQGIDVKVDGQDVIVSKGSESLTQTIDSRFTVEIENNELQLKRPNDTKEIKALHGLYRSLINNMVVGLHTGFEKKLEINGVGFRAIKSGNTITLNIGYSHPVIVVEPEGITIEVPAQNRLTVKGADKQLVGETAAKIRALRAPEPYKGKGIRYENEVIRRKAGKTASAKK